MESHKKLLSYQKQITELQCMSNIVFWELRVSVPNEAKKNIISIKNKLESKIFELKTDSTYEELLSDCINSSYFKELPLPEQKYIKKLLKEYYDNTKVPRDFYDEYQEQCNITTIVWQEAKDTNNYEIYRPELEKIIEMTKQYYSYINPDEDLYDVMLDRYEIGMTSDIIDELFEELKTSIIPLIKKIKTTNTPECSMNCSKEELYECAKYLLNYIGFDMNRGTLGIYTHAFTEKISPNDIRIGFRNTTDPTDFVTTITHEGGHGIFEQNIASNLSEYRNGVMENLYALHESQSRFYENILGRNINFWIPIYDDIKRILKLDYTLEEFAKNLNIVRPNPIRVESDELTYCLHIIIRYEIERDIFKGNINLSDLPAIWNKKVKEYLGIDITNEKEGLMQDIHWAEGNFGYFPSYLLGTVYDGMFLEVIEENLGSIDDLLREGNIKLITNFLINNIYTYGESYNSQETFERVCGKKLSVKPIIKYFESKYNKED